MRSVEVEGKTFVETFTPQMIDSYVQQIADAINHEYEGSAPLFVGVLNGAFIFAADLFRKINLPSTIRFVRLKSYVDMGSSGEVKELLGLSDEDVRDKDVIIIEDIVDSGTTMHYYKQRLLSQGAKSVKVACLCFKPEALQFADAQPDYVGMDISRLFVVGYGLDLNGQARNLDGIYTLRS